MEKGGSVYILTNKYKTVLYTGVTSNLQVRLNQHKTKFYPNSFTAKYNCDILVYYKSFHDIEEAISFEKYIKNHNRSWKNKLINDFNVGWKDLSEEVLNW